MAGENSNDKRTGGTDEFLSKSRWQRFQVLIMGPAMNILLAVSVMALVLYQGAEVPAYEEQPAIVGSVVPDSPAERVGIKAGDQIISVAGYEIGNWEHIVFASWKVVS